MNPKVAQARPYRSPIRALAAVALFAVLAPACGEQKFKSIPSQQQTGAPGSFTVPPKIDILIAEDDTGSMYEAYQEISAQIPDFLSALEEKNWDYRLATTPLVNQKSSQPRPLNQILASKFDPNWGSAWTPPYPSAQPGLVDAVRPEYFRKAGPGGNYSHFLTWSDIDNRLNGREEGLENIDSTLTARAPAVGFLRPDALLAVIVIGNGDDTSRVNYCTRSDGVIVACNDGSYESSLTYFKSRLIQLKASPALVRFYAAVSSANRSGCRGGAAYRGSRYKRLEQELTGNLNFDICSQSVSAVLESIAQNLQSQKLTFRTRYLFIGKEPNPATIKVRKFIGGNPDQPIDLPNSASGGWTYAGYLKNAYAIDSPVPMSLTTGWAIELHGAGKLHGDDRAEVTFTPRGFAPSAN